MTAAYAPAILPLRSKGRRGKVLRFRGGATSWGVDFGCNISGATGCRRCQRSRFYELGDIWAAHLLRGEGRLAGERKGGFRNLARPN